MPAHVAQARDGIRKVAEAHRAYRREIPALDGQGHPDRPRRVELLVRAQRVRRARHALLPAGRPRDRGGAPRALPQQRHLLHGQLRPDRERDRRDQDDEDRGRAGDDRPRAGALPAPLRDAAGAGDGRRAAARRGGGVDRRPRDADGRDRQPDARGARARCSTCAAPGSRGRRAASCSTGADPLAHNAPGRPARRRRPARPRSTEAPARRSRRRPALSVSLYVLPRPNAERLAPVKLLTVPSMRYAEREAKARVDASRDCVNLLLAHDVEDD